MHYNNGEKNFKVKISIRNIECLQLFPKQLNQFVIQDNTVCADQTNTSVHDLNNLRNDRTIWF